MTGRRHPVHPGECGLAAVARVRGVRERDSRLGLVAALGDLRAREARVAELESSLRVHGSFDSGDMATFVALRASLAALREELVADRARLDVARTVATDADARWQHDRSRLGAVEGLLDRRAEDRRVERRRADDKDMDEVASQGWLRRTGVEEGPA